MFLYLFLFLGGLWLLLSGSPIFGFICISIALFGSIAEFME